MVHEDIYRALMHVDWKLEPHEQRNRLVESGLLEDVLGDGSILIYKPYQIRALPPKGVADAIRDVGHKVIQYADLILVRKPRIWEDPKPCPPWTHAIAKSRSGSMIWDEWFDRIPGLNSGFHHTEIDGRIEDRVFLDDRSLRAFKVLLQ